MLGLRVCLLCLQADLRHDKISKFRLNSVERTFPFSPPCSSWRKQEAGKMEKTKYVRKMKEGTRMRKKEEGEKGKKRERSETIPRGTRDISRHFQVSSWIFRRVIELTSPFLTSTISRSILLSFPLHLSVSRSNSIVHVRNRLIERVDIASITLQSLPILFTFPEIPFRDDCRREQRDTPFFIARPTVPY